jgi:hypothetical protein
MKTYILAIIALTFINTSYADTEEIVNWTGTLQDSGTHSELHNHALEFIKNGDSDSYKIVDSPELAKTHCDKSKKLKIKITAVKTPQFLFWGNNLVVKSFEVLEELEEVPHKKPLRNKPRAFEHGRIDRI